VEINIPQPSIFTGSHYRDLSGLEPLPIVKQWIVEGAPEATAKKLMETGDGASFFVWDCTAGSFRWRYAEDEIVCIIAGEVFIMDDVNSRERRLGEGDMAFFPAGSSALWRVPVRVRKLALFQREVLIVRAWKSLKRRWPRIVARRYARLSRVLK
jgi:uncharacterized cupin superfamily protein